MNIVILRGTLSSDTSQRDLPSGSRMLSYEVTIRHAEGAAESVPVVWFDPPASTPLLSLGSEVVVTGRVRRRFFRSRGVTASRTEVVAHGVLRSGQRRRIEGALAAAMAEAG